MILNESYVKTLEEELPDFEERQKLLQMSIIEQHWISR